MNNFEINNGLTSSLLHCITTVRINFVLCFSPFHLFLSPFHSFLFKLTGPLTKKRGRNRPSLCPHDCKVQGTHRCHSTRAHTKTHAPSPRGDIEACQAYTQRHSWLHCSVQFPWQPEQLQHGVLGAEAMFYPARVCPLFCASAIVTRVSKRVVDY